MLDETLARHHELFGLREVVALGDILLKRTGIDADTNRAPSGARGIDHRVNLGPIADIAGIDPHLIHAGADRFQGQPVVKMDIRH